MHKFLKLLSEFDDQPKSAFKIAFTELSNEDIKQLLITIHNSGKFSNSAKAWFYKSAAQRKCPLPIEIIEWIKEMLVANDEWHCLLNLLQISDDVFQHDNFQIAEEQRTLFNRYHFLLSNEKIMIRAWAYHGLIRIAHSHEGYTREVQQIIKLANKDGTGSIIARIRNSLKKYPLD